MKAGNGQHFEQAYNAQAAVNEVMLIVGQRGSDAPNDKQELVATVQAICPVVVAAVHAVLIDSGFLQCGGRAKRGAKAGRDAEWLDRVCGGGQTKPSQNGGGFITVT